MLDYNPDNRPTASECLQSEYFKVTIPIPLNATTSDYDDEDVEEFKQTFTDRKTTENFSSQMKSEISKNKKQETDLTSSISSLNMMKRARYKPSVNTKQFLKLKQKM